MMYDQGLSGWADEIVQIVDDPEHTERFVIRKSARGYYQYVYEIPVCHCQWKMVEENCWVLYEGRKNGKKSNGFICGRLSI